MHNTITTKKDLHINSFSESINSRQPFLYLFLGFILGVIATAIYTQAINNTPKIELPEEYFLITPEDTLQGNYNTDTKTLEIWFNNKQNTK